MIEANLYSLAQANEINSLGEILDDIQRINSYTMENDFFDEYSIEEICKILNLSNIQQNPIAEKIYNVFFNENIAFQTKTNKELPLQASIILISELKNHLKNETVFTSVFYTLFLKNGWQISKNNRAIFREENQDSWYLYNATKNNEPNKIQALLNIIRESSFMGIDTTFLFTPEEVYETLKLAIQSENLNLFKKILAQFYCYNNEISRHARADFVQFLAEDFSKVKIEDLFVYRNFDEFGLLNYPIKAFILNLIEEKIQNIKNKYIEEPNHYKHFNELLGIHSWTEKLNELFPDKFSRDEIATKIFFDKVETLAASDKITFYELQIYSHSLEKLQETSGLELKEEIITFFTGIIQNSKREVVEKLIDSIFWEKNKHFLPRDIILEGYFYYTANAIKVLNVEKVVLLLEEYPEIVHLKGRTSPFRIKYVHSKATQIKEKNPILGKLIGKALMEPEGANLLWYSILASHSNEIVGNKIVKKLLSAGAQINSGNYFALRMALFFNSKLAAETFINIIDHVIDNEKILILAMMSDYDTFKSIYKKAPSENRKEIFMYYLQLFSTCMEFMSVDILEKTRYIKTKYDQLYHKPQNNNSLGDDVDSALTIISKFLTIGSKNKTED